MANYRPITLLNTDLKLFTKILSNRAKPVLNGLIQPHQYAKPSTSVFDATTLIRHVRWEAISRGWEAYVISLDFEKAFDSVDQEYLGKVINKMKFPPRFRAAISNLYRSANLKILINFIITCAKLFSSAPRQNDQKRPKRA